MDYHFNVCFFSVQTGWIIDDVMQLIYLIFYFIIILPFKDNTYINWNKKKEANKAYEKDHLQLNILPN